MAKGSYLPKQWRDWGSTEEAAGTVRGLRSWKIDGCFMLGHWKGTWVPGENIARCRFGGQDIQSPDHGSPSPSCTCGIYAWWALLPYHRRDGEVYGIVDGYGHVLVGTKGFRCERAMLLGIAPKLNGLDPFTTRSEVRDMVELLGYRYDVPVLPSIKDLLIAYPLRGKPDEHDD